MPAKLRKSRTDKMIAGVCGGIANYLGWDSTLVRIIFLIIVFFSGGTMILFYFILALIMPD
jgi:phage shock protein C